MKIHKLNFELKTDRSLPKEFHTQLHVHAWLGRRIETRRISLSIFYHIHKSAIWPFCLFSHVISAILIPSISLRLSFNCNWDRLRKKWVLCVQSSPIWRWDSFEVLSETTRLENCRLCLIESVSFLGAIFHSYFLLKLNISKGQRTES